MSHHPSSHMLAEFASGGLTAGTSIATAVHLDHCGDCQKRVSSLQSQMAEHWFDNDASFGADESDQLLESLMAALPDEPVGRSAQEQRAQVEEVLRSIDLDGHNFELPTVLGKIAQEGLKWRRLPGGIRQAAVSIDNDTICSFLYMKPGGKIPEHTHDGEELTLVLDGSFSDELGTYCKGDLVVRNAEHNHSSISEGGCLCFTVQDHPVIFTKGFSRLLNPLSQHLFGH